VEFRNNLKLAVSFSRLQAAPFLSVISKAFGFGRGMLLAAKY